MFHSSVLTKWCAVVLAAWLVLGAAQAVPAAEKWSFGVMSDTQWTTSGDTANNPGTVSVGIIKQLNQQFIDKGVKLVVQVGDLVDSEGTNAANLSVRATAAQQLNDAGIGFFPSAATTKAARPRRRSSRPSSPTPRPRA
jgi:hypothetical protein